MMPGGFVCGRREASIPAAGLVIANPLANSILKTRVKQY